MKKIEIQNLIDRYLAAETTPDEERQLALELQREADLAGVEALPEDWQAVRLMLGELTLGEAVFDELMAARKTASPVVSDGSRASRRILPFWRWTAAAVFVIAAGLGALLYQLKAPSHLTANVSTTDGTHESYQWDMQVPPVGHADSIGRIGSHDQSHQSTQSVVPKPTCKRMMNSMRSESTSPSVETIEETINPDMELLAQQVQNIRQRGERLQRMVDAIVNME